MSRCQLKSIFFVAALLPGCVLDPFAPSEGEERGPCYGNNTCDDGLICRSDLCIDDEGEGEGEGEGDS